MSFIRTTFEFDDNDKSDDNKPWDGILAATMFAVKAIFHTTTQVTPAQLGCDCNTIMNTKFEANWNYIWARKQKLISQNNKNENKKRVSHIYWVDDKVLLIKQTKFKYDKPKYDSSHQAV